MGSLPSGGYAIRIPVDMYQITDKTGRAKPVAFIWVDENGAEARVKIEKIISCVPMAEQKSGTVGDRYECLIGGKIEYIYYTILAPRKWFRFLDVTEEEYNDYYRLPE
ncbi:MAG: hypothetical protein LBS21_12995 [Clostridiales bacterium]|jgi:hypothetical protein|nr:hypothetical protein [Clostridiales bacterium]